MNFSIIIPLFAGIAAGWVVNYLADVLPFTRSFSRPVCPSCGHNFNMMEYLLLRPCGNGHPRSARSWIVLLTILVISCYSWFFPPAKIGYLLGLILITYFGVIFVIDLEHRLILHPTSIFGALLGLGVGI